MSNSRRWLNVSVQTSFLHIEEPLSTSSETNLSKLLDFLSTVLALAYFYLILSRNLTVSDFFQTNFNKTTILKLNPWSFPIMLIDAFFLFKMINSNEVSKTHLVDQNHYDQQCMYKNTLKTTIERTIVDTDEKNNHTICSMYNAYIQIVYNILVFF